MSKPYPRSRRINAIIHEVLATELEGLSDPRLGLVTVTGVEVSPDMKKAVVYVDALDQDHLVEGLKGLHAAAPRLRSALGHQMHTKYVPSLDFQIDQGVVQGERIAQLLRQLGESNESWPNAGPDEG